MTEFGIVVQRNIASELDWCQLGVVGFAFTRSLSYDMSIASSRAGSPPSAIYYLDFNFQCVLVSLRRSGSCRRFRLRLLLPVTYIFPSVRCFRRQVLSKMWPMKLAFRFIVHVCRNFVPSLSLCNTSSYFTRSAQLIFPIITFQNFSDISDPLSKVSKFQHQIQHFTSL